MKPMPPMKPMQPMAPMQPMRAAERWWPDELGEPSSSGTSNDTRYAYFDGRHRLAVRDGERVRVYDTGSRRITGFAQGDGEGGALRFDSDAGTIGVDALREL